MSASAVDHFFESVTRFARGSGQRLSRYRGRNRPLTIRVITEQEQPLELPAGAVALLMDILEAMAAGRGVSIIPENALRENLNLSIELISSTVWTSTNFGTPGMGVTRGRRMLLGRNLP